MDNNLKQNKTWYKIWRRLCFLLCQAWRINWEVILCSLFPIQKRSGAILGNLLNKRKIINWPGQDMFIWKDQKIFCFQTPPFIDILSVLSSNDPYIQKNFSKNMMYGFEGPYEYGSVTLRHGDYVVDAGANFGFFSVLASKKIGSNGLVFAFEPIKTTMSLLQKTVSTNQLNNIQLFKQALGESEGGIDFFLFDSLGQSSMFNLKNEEIVDKETVEQISLDSFVVQRAIAKIDFIKADIEGMERYLLLGAEQTIKRFKPRLALCTYHHPDDPEVLEKLIKSFVPEYNIIQAEQKLYAWID